MQTQTQEILSWFGPLDQHSVPKQPTWDFLYPWFCTHKANTLYTTWQNNHCQIRTILLYTKKTTTHCTTSLLHQEDALVQFFSLTDYNQSYKHWDLYVIVNKDLTSGLSEFFMKGLEFVWRTESGTNFLKNRIF